MGTSNEDEKKGNDQCRNKHINQFNRVNQQSQREEKQYLAHPCKTIHKLHGSTFMNEPGVSDNHSCNINSQVTVSFQVISRCKYKYSQKPAAKQDTVRRWPS